MVTSVVFKELLLLVFVFLIFFYIVGIVCLNAEDAGGEAVDQRLDDVVRYLRQVHWFEFGPAKPNSSEQFLEVPVRVVTPYLDPDAPVTAQ
jgi:hypothetical protein